MIGTGATRNLNLQLRRLVLAVATITAISGLFQMLLPDIVLHFVGASSAPAARHFFSLVGMFMLLVGAELWVGVRVCSSGVVLCLAAQKEGAEAGGVFGFGSGIGELSAITVP